MASARRVVLVLGSKPGLTGRRWLTNQEIADAAIEALQDGESRQVGDPEPV